MTSSTIRPFQRTDRDQLTALMNAHIAAVIPGVALTVNAAMSQLEREPEEFIVDPWVAERLTLVAELRSRVVGAAHLLRYSADRSVGEDYRGIGEIRWFVFWPTVPSNPDNPYWPDPVPAADELLRRCCDQLDEWHVFGQHADGNLPSPAVYGVPEQWAHIRAAYTRAGFQHGGRVEIVYMASLADLKQTMEPPLPGLSMQRSVGINGTRFSAVLAESTVGYIEVEVTGSRQSSLVTFADIGNLHIAEAYQRRGIASWLLCVAAAWLRRAGVDHILDYAVPEETERIAFLGAAGFQELTRAARGWTRSPG